jgi:4-amino-4-deoxy-L-arabinose transferase-like glycosyltransferase
MASLIPVFGYKITRLLFEEKIARTVSALMIIEPYSVLLSFLLYSETSFTFFFIISLYFLVKNFYKGNNLYMIWSGIFLGLALLIKPTVQYFPILIPLFFIIVFWKNNLKNRLIQAMLYSAIAVMIISPWLIRNFNYFGKMEMTVQPAFNLYVYLVPTILSIDNKTNFATELDNFVYKKGVNVFDINLANQAKYKMEAIPIILDHKFALVKSVMITIVTFFTHDGMLTVLQYSGINITNVVNIPFINLIFSPIALTKAIWHYLFSPAILIILGRLFWFILTLLMLYGILNLYRNKQFRSQHILISLVILYFALTTSINGLGVNARFRVPVLSLIFGFAVYGFYAILAFIKTKYYEKNIDSSSCI